MKLLKNFIFIIGLAFTFGLMPANTYAVDSVITDQCLVNPDAAVCKGQSAKPTDLIKDIVNILLYVVGAISLLMLIVGGIMYTTSAGDSGRVTKAKNTVTYAVIGLVASFLAIAIVQFVVTRFK